MKRRRRILLLLFGCAAAAVVAFLVWRGEQELVYKGKTLSEWRGKIVFDSHGNPMMHPPESQEAVEAIRNMRDQIIPRAVAMLRYEKPGWKNAIQNLMEALDVPEWAPRWVWSPIYKKPAIEAVYFFRILGESATPAIPQLEAIATDPRARNAPSAVYALSRIGTNALPALVRIVTNTQSGTRIGAFETLGRFSTNAAFAIPTLVPCLGDPDCRIAAHTAEFLGRLALQPELCVPALANHSNYPHELGRRPIIVSLGNFGEAARPAIPSLLAALGDSDWGVRREATNALRKVAPEILGQAPSFNATTNKRFEKAENRVARPH